MQPGDEITFEQEIWFDGYRLGTTDGIQSGQIKIQRGSDGLFWDGSVFAAPEVWNDTTVDAGGLFHSYTFLFPEDMSELYNMRMRVNEDTNTESVFSVLTRDYEE